MLDLLQKLKENNVRLTVDGDSLKVGFDGDVIDAGLLEALKANKAELLEYFKKYEAKKGFENIPVLPVQESYQLSSAQKRLWILAQFDDGAVAYNMPSVIELRGQYDFENFKKAMDAVIQRHEILRTVLKVNREGEIRQWILSREAYGFTPAYLDFLNQAHGEERAREFIQEDSYKPFNMETGPLLRACLIRLAEDRFIFYFNMHHIIGDGWSDEILAREILAYYAFFQHGEKLDLLPLKIQYKDYAHWQNEKLNGEDLQRHKDYWLHQLSGELPILELPASKPRPKIKTYNGQALSTFISADTTRGLKAFCQQQGGTLFMGLLAAWNILFEQYTSAHEFIIGTAVAGRDHEDLENQIGFYISALPLRNRVDTAESFIAFFQRVKETTLNAYQHQAYPLDKIVEDLDLKRDTSRSALFDVMLTFQNHTTNSHKETAPEAGDEITDLGFVAPRFDVSFEIQEVDNRLHFFTSYNSDVYDREMIGALIRHYKQLIAALLAHPEQPIKSVSYLSDTEKQQLLTGFNDTYQDFGATKTLLELFAEQVKRTPDAPAVEYNQRQWTYTEFDEWTNQLARCLTETYSVKANEVIGIKLDRSEWLLASIFAVLKAGAAYVPIDPDYPESREAYILKDSAIHLLITDSVYMFDCGGYSGTIFAIDVEFESDRYGKEPLPGAIDPAGTAYIIYTSGSTGNPKGVVINHTALANYLSWCRLNYRPETQKADFGLFTSPSFDLTVTSLFLPLVSGGKLKIWPPTKNIPLLLRQYFESDLACIKLTPAHLSLISDLEIGQTNIGLAIIGGDVLHASHVEYLRKLNPAMVIYNEYGPTEATVGCVVERVEGNDVRAIGKPIANTQILLLDAHLALVPIGVIGEMCIGGAGLAQGYHNLAELSAERFIENPFNRTEILFKTGDFGRWRSDGKIEFFGRENDQVKVNGYRIELGEIENALLQYAGVKQSVASVLENGEGDKELCAYLVSAETPDPARLRTFLKSKLPDYMLPVYYIRVDEIPLTTNGKVDKAALPAPDAAHLSSQTDYIAPVDEIKSQLVDIWEAVLKRERIGVKDDFFALGGHSIKAVKLIAEVQRVFEIKIDMTRLFYDPTIAGLAQEVKNHLWQKEEVDENHVSDKITI